MLKKIILSKNKNMYRDRPVQSEQKPISRQIHSTKKEKKTKQNKNETNS